MPTVRTQLVLSGTMLEGWRGDRRKLIKLIFDNSARVSGERIWTEWAKILVGNHGGQLTKCMVEVGLIHIKNKL